MTSTTARPGPAPVGQPVETTELQRKPFAPIRLFGLLGAFWIVLATVTWIRWAVSDDFGATPNGPDHVSDSREIFYGIIQTVSTIVVIGLLLKFTIIPLVRRRKLTFDGMFIPGLLLAYFIDPLANYFNYTFLYNSELFNRGSWGGLTPGFVAPDQHKLPEPLFFLSGMYVWGGFGAAVVGCWFIKKMRERFPTMGTATMLVITYVVFCIGIFIFEGIFIIRIFEIYSIAGPSEITVFDGERYQYPLHEMALFGTWCVTMTSLRFFMDDRGRSIAQRGAEQLRISEKAKQGVATVAVMGAVATGTFLAYFVPYQAFSMKADSWPEVPSYLNAICGEGTEYACPGELAPIHTETSIKIPPDDPRLSAGN